MATRRPVGPGVRRGMAPGTAASAELGKMSRSQAVTTYGVGSVYEFRTFGVKALLQSVIVKDHLDWGMRGAEAIVLEPVLQRALRKRYFRLPPDGTTPAAIAVSRFPRTLVCSKCQKLGVAPREFDDDGRSSPKCRKHGCTGKGIPARLIAACDNPDPSQLDTQPGHIEDFPWSWWAHTDDHRGEGAKRCINEELYLVTVKGLSGLQGLRVECRACDAKRTLAGVFGNEALRGCSCRGSRPWLSGAVGHEVGCSRPLRALQRGASNLYFPVHASALSIPPYSQKLYSLLSDAFDVISNFGELKPDQMIRMLRNGRPELEEFTDEQINSVMRVLANLDDEASIDEAEQRRRERRAFLEGADHHEFVAIPAAPHASLSRVLDSVTAVHRLREVRVLRGFHRIKSELGANSWEIHCAPITANTGAEWLPAMEVRGEGVYFELNADQIAAWEYSPLVVSRLKRLNVRLMRTTGDRAALLSRPAFVLVHTVTHLLMKQLSLESGYSLASLRERIYCDLDAGGRIHAGALIYTSTPSSEGTLGGLVANAEPEAFEKVLRAAVENARWCSSDPLCSESDGQGSDALNLAACHACALVSETSCEYRNSILDRCLVVGSLREPDIGFFQRIGD